MGIKHCLTLIILFACSHAFSAEEFCRLEKDDSGNPLFCEITIRDNSKHTIQKTLYGNLSGECEFPLIVNENNFPISNGIEHYTTTFHYSPNAQLLMQQEDNGRTIRFVYDIDCKHPKAKFICDHNCILIRHFYTYDQNNQLSQIIIDNGCTEEINDLSEVSLRKIISFDQSDDTWIIEHKVWDFSENREVLVCKEIEHYSHQGELQHQILFDSNLDYSYGLFKELQPGLRSTIDSNGRSESLQFDEKGNLIFQQENDDPYQLWTYNEVSKPFSKEKKDKWGQSTTTLIEYDSRGRKTASKDHNGNSTTYEYDASDRLIKKTFPAVLNASGRIVQGEIQYEYNSSNKLRKIIDPEGGITEIKYNARLLPIEIIYPNDSRECFSYHLDGTLKTHIKRSGLKTTYERDPFGRILKEQVLTKTNEPIRTITQHFDGFHLLSRTNEHGITTEFAYDAKGLLHEKRVLGELGAVRTNYFYDKLGNLSQIQEWFGDGPKDYTVTRIKRNSQNEITYKFIEASNRKLIQTIKAKQEFVPNKIILSEPTTNTIGQQVDKITSIDKKGIVNTIQYDALGREEIVEQSDSEQTLLSRKEIRYDSRGNKVWQAFEQFSEKKSPQTQITTWRYNAADQLLEITEGHETETPSTTRFSYDADGELSSIQKPNGISLYFTYNDQHKLTRVASSDGTVDYQLQYDENGKAIQITDTIHNAHTTCIYDNSQHISQELLGNGLLLKYEYDRNGKRSALHLPDGSSIQYTYDGPFIKSIQKYTKTKKLEYSHDYEQFDKQGLPTVEKLIGKAGTLQRTWNQDRRCSSMTSQHYAISLPEEAYNEHGNIIQMAVSDPIGSSSQHYSYDTLQRLTHEISHSEHSYNYDSLSNRIEHDGTCYHYGKSNQLLQHEETHYTYDLNGNLTERRSGNEKTFYQYDALDRVIEIIEDGSVKHTYTYDIFNRRLTATTLLWNAFQHDWAVNKEIKFLYDGQNEIGSIDSSGEICELRIIGLGLGSESGAAIAIEIGEGNNRKVYAPLHDIQGSICCLIDAETGKASEIYRYSAFGDTQIYNDKKQLLQISDINNPWQFCSKRLDDTGLIAFGRRYYDPNTGRWITPDPTGQRDGPNRYAYVQNNPLNQMDQYGLFSLSSAWQSALTFMNDYYNDMIEGSTNVIRHLAQQLEFFGVPQASVEKHANDFFGEGFLVIGGYYNSTGTSGTYGKGEVSDKVRVTCINGIMTTLPIYLQQIHGLSESHGNVNVHYVYRPTNGFACDVAQTGLLIHLDHISSETIQLAQKWKALIQEMGGPDNEGIILHYCHSAGTADSFQAKKLLTSEEQQMIRIHSFGTVKFYPDQDYESVTHYVSVRDGVPMLDLANYLKAYIKDEDHVVFVGSHKDGLPIIDHLFTCDSYSQIWKELGEEFVKTYGSIDSY